MDSSQLLDKWQRVAAIVTQHSTSQSDLRRQFQKLFIQRLLAENFLVFLLQYSGLTLSTLTSHPKPLWLACGTACAFIFLRGYSVVPGIFAGSFLAYYFAKSGLGLACTCAAIYSLQAFLLLYICQRFISPSLIFYRKISFVKFILCSAILTAAVSAALEYFCYDGAARLLVWIQWWLANFNGIMVFSTALIALDTYFPQIETLKNLDKSKLGLLYGGLLVCVIALALSHTPALIICFAISSLLLTMLISKYYAWCGAVMAIFLLGLSLSLAALLGAPLFSNNFASSTAIFLQLILSLGCFSLLKGINHAE